MTGLRARKSLIIEPVGWGRGGGILHASKMSKTEVSPHLVSPNCADTLKNYFFFLDKNREMTLLSKLPHNPFDYNVQHGRVFKCWMEKQPPELAQHEHQKKKIWILTGQSLLIFKGTVQPTARVKVRFANMKHIKIFTHVRIIQWVKTANVRLAFFKTSGLFNTSSWMNVVNVNTVDYVYNLLSRWIIHHLGCII